MNDSVVVHTLRCRCGKTCEAQVPVSAASWDRAATVAQSHGWVPVIKGDAVGMSAGTHFYACSPLCQTQWLESLPDPR